ncbi:MAG: LptA/OstA family protein [Pseudomonadota bacterium]
MGVAVRLFLVLALSWSHAWAQGGVGFDSEKPSEIDAARVERKDAGLTWIGEGDVRVSQPGVVLTADEMIIKLSAETGEIESIEAMGSVRYANVQGDALAGDHAFFEAGGNQLTVTGSVVVLQGPQVATADKLTYNTITGAMVMSTEPGGRVRGLFAGQDAS